ncbi:isochorismatase family protein [Bradyrhizobium sp. 40]|uniref:isochorismatase family protein n=1 Tax=Bradyrhizobium sp. 40 TaxID=2782674 RepID=UPI001FFEDE17|nr:isochorismatase family protein [Bradyrhizobium sp. 40]UPJ39993.1 isochorismatase family protein [Bradyrhizobium sp. 40]
MVLVNPMRGETRTTSDGAAGAATLSLLQAGAGLFGTKIIVAGESQLLQLPEQAGASFVQVNASGLYLWDDQGFADALEASTAGAIVLGGAWLEEDVFIAALEAARRGYDVRLPCDLTSPRVERDGAIVLDRLALHGVLATTVRQLLLEWAVFLNDPLLKHKVGRLLS